MTLHSPFAGKISRRDAVRHGLAVGVTCALAGSPRLTLAQASPAASPTAGTMYAHPESLVDVGWLQQRITDPAVVVVGLMPKADFDPSHIDGARQVDPSSFEVVDTSDASIDAWNQSLDDLIGALGVVSDSEVVAYDNGTLFAARLWWVLAYLGHQRVHVLDGGLPAWKEAGFDISAGAAQAARDTGSYPGAPNPSMLAQLEEVLSSVGNPDVAILDARTPEEYAKGHIPGAVNLNFTRNANDTPPKRYRPASELRAMYEEIGVTPDRTVIPYCSSGVRSAVTAHTLHLIGYEHVALYTGSWQEWSAHPDTPKATGSTP